ncbi:MAG: DUF1015 domain-containing protein [Christensenellales bacterium]
MYDFLRYGIRKPRILYPDSSCDMHKWAVVACDQFSSQPEYWRAVEETVGDAPSTLRMIYPEAYLRDAPAPAEEIRRTMLEYRKTVLTREVHDFVFVRRQTHAGERLGLIAEIDLEAYDFYASSAPLIRATEGTILSRIPPRVEIRQNAVLETPHTMLLADDPERTLLEPLCNFASEKLYDFELMQGGGHISGWRISGEKAHASMQNALAALFEKARGMLFAVGDGNHSLAAARQCWLDMRARIPQSQWADHPMRYALVEICNLHGDGMAFEPIHRAIFGANEADLVLDFVLWCRGKGISVSASDDNDVAFYLLDSPVKLYNAINPLPLATLQPFLDQWVASHEGVSIDYIHGDEALAEMKQRGAAAIKLGAFDKKTLFEAVRVGGALPLKTFSMGDAQDKRYYLECRALV